MACRFALFFGSFLAVAAMALPSARANTANIGLDNITGLSAYDRADELKGEFQLMEDARAALRAVADKFSGKFDFGQNTPGYLGADRWIPIEISENDTLYRHNMMALLGACSLYYRAASTYDPKLPGWEDTIETKLKYLAARKADAKKWTQGIYGGTLPKMGFSAYVAMVQKAECCGAGTYNYSNYGFDSGGCAKCEPGFYCFGGSNRFACPADTIGSFGRMNAGAESKDDCGHKVCGEGYWWDEAGDSCALCPAGFWCPGGMDDSMKECPADMVSLAGTARASDCFVETCPAGKFFDGASGTCMLCPAGQYNEFNDNSTSCQVCPVGKRATPDHSGCEDMVCNASKFQWAVAGMDECFVCNGAREFWTAATATCGECPTGTKPNNAKTKCNNISCNANSILNGNDCEACPSGEKPNAAKTDCEAFLCAPGQFVGANDCQACPAGTYQPNGGSSEKTCSACPANFVSNAARSGCECPSGRLLIDGACAPCPNGAVCSGVDAETFECASPEDKPVENACVPRCAAGTIWNVVSETCEEPNPWPRLLADLPQVYTWNGAEWRLPNLYNGSAVDNFGQSMWDASLLIGGIYPGYWVQSMCSSDAGSYRGQPGSPAWANAQHCWCRLKRRSDDANSGFAFLETRANCARDCATSCANATASFSSFRTALLSSF
ncbi:MAG: hypothetical protein LBH81_02020 [Rickettsiales bacterium]|nr:hypothetical protein [Rickettsiales bacterium]